MFDMDDAPIFAARRIDDAWLISAPSDDPFLPAWVTVAIAWAAMAPSVPPVPSSGGASGP